MTGGDFDSKLKKMDVSFFSTVHGSYGCVVFHFQRSQCVLSHVCCAGVPCDILQSRNKVSQLPWISNIYH